MVKATRRLRFSKSGAKSIEDQYATRYINANRILQLDSKKAINYINQLLIIC